MHTTSRFLRQAVSFFHPFSFFFIAKVCHRPGLQLHHEQLGCTKKPKKNPKKTQQKTRTSPSGGGARQRGGNNPLVFPPWVRTSQVAETWRNHRYIYALVMYTHARIQSRRKAGIYMYLWLETRHLAEFNWIVVTRTDLQTVASRLMFALELRWRHKQKQSLKTLFPT